ncbi:MAG: hypothetical protein WA919_00450 [Coleofasciculaceae cyanobacterium]
MSEQPEELAITPSAAISSPERNTSNLTRNSQLADELLKKANSPQEALNWVEIRQEVLRQNEYVKEENHQRILEKTRLIYGIAFSATVCITGLVLFICQYENSLYLIAVGLLPLLSKRKITEP